MNDIKALFAKENFLWFVGFMLFPFYVFSSGGIQLSTPVLLIAALVELSRVSVSRSDRPFYSPIITRLAVFAVYVALVQLVWSVILDDYKILIFSTFYVMNILIFAAVSRRLLKDPGFLGVIITIFAASVFLQCFLSFFFSHQGLRSTLYFNNPNQLGYFVLLSGCIFSIGIKKRSMGMGLYILAMLACVWLSQLSLSKSAMLAGAFLLIYGAASNARTLVVACMLGLMLPSLASVGIFGERMEVVSYRLSTIGEDADDSAEGRGYDRIWLHPEMMVLGGGEGAVQRWGSFAEHAEIHSTWATVLFSYGIIGALCIYPFVLRIMMAEARTTFVPLFVLMFYGITHNGIRFVPFWVVLAIATALMIRKKEARARKQVAAPNVALRT